jgi:hypothetical protein
MIKNYYQILGLEPSVTKEEIKKAYRIYATKFHPDKQNNDKFFEERFKEVKEAYDTLIDDHKRGAYDAKLKHQTNSNNSSNSFYTSQSYSENGIYEDLVKRHQEEEQKEKTKRGKVYYTSKNLLLNGLYINCKGENYNLSDYDSATIRRDDNSNFITLGIILIIVGILTITFFVGILFLVYGILALFYKEYFIVLINKTGDAPLIKGRKSKMKKIVHLINEAMLDNK